MTQCWFVIRTKRFCEVQACLWISNQAGYETLCPMLKQHVVANRRRVEITLPMFPNYVFGRFDIDVPGWGSIACTRGVKNIMCDPQGKPLPLRDEVIHILRKRDGEVDSEIRAVRDLKAGDQVLIHDEPFAGIKGLFSSRAQDRVFVLLDLLGKRHQIAFPETAISALTA